MGTGDLGLVMGKEQNTPENMVSVLMRLSFLGLGSKLWLGCFRDSFC